MCKRCATLEYQISLCTLSHEVARLWMNDAPPPLQSDAEIRVQAAEDAIRVAEQDLLNHRKSSGCSHSAA